MDNKWKYEGIFNNKTVILTIAMFLETSGQCVNFLYIREVAYVRKPCEFSNLCELSINTRFAHKYIVVEFVVEFRFTHSSFDFPNSGMKTMNMFLTTFGTMDHDACWLECPILHKKFQNRCDF